ncbi:MAG: hypothetical protein ACRYFX_15685 [Janthinobacterium lividum]
MNAAHEHLYQRTLHELIMAGVEFCIIGTYGLRPQCPALAHHPVPDCDLMLPPTLPNLNALVHCLQTDGWAVTLWEQPVQLPLTAGEIVGKYYLRARQAGAVLDCSYENDFQTWADFASQLHWHEGLPLASVAHILFQKVQCGRPGDREVLRLLNRTSKSA